MSKANLPAGGGKGAFLLPRACLMLFLGILAAAAGAIAGEYRFAEGVLAGLMVGLFNYWLLSAAVLAASRLDPIEAQTFFFKRAFMRFLVAFSTLFLSMPFGAPVVLGVGLGLSLQGLSYFLDAGKILLGKG